MIRIILTTLAIAAGLAVNCHPTALARTDAAQFDTATSASDA